MKKTLYVFLIPALILTSCSKEEDVIQDTTTSLQGCTDQDAENYNIEGNGRCIYNITGSVWSVVSQSIDGEEFYPNMNHYFWQNGDYGEIQFDNDGNENVYGGPGKAHFNSWPEDNTLTIYEGLSDTVNSYIVDYMTDNDHMTLRSNSNGEVIIINLERTSEASALESWEWRKERQIQGYVWEATSVTINEMHHDTIHEMAEIYDMQLYYFFDDQTVGIQVRNNDWPTNNVNYYTEALTLSMTPYKMTHLSGFTPIVSVGWDVDVDMTPGTDNMTLTYHGFPVVGDTYTITLVRSTIYSIDEW